MSETTEEATNDSRVEAPQDIDAVLMAVWRRVMAEGCGPELSMTEAAAILGASIQSVRRRVAAGLIPSYRDDRGRIRIVPRIGLPGEVFSTGETPTMIEQLIDDLRSTREQLSRAVHERAHLLNQKVAVEHALEQTKEELSAMWRLLSARTSQGPAETKAPAKAKPAGTDNRMVHLSPANFRVDKVQSQVEAMRKLAKRRKWPWALVG
jgi:hypothetical protein